MKRIFLLLFLLLTAPLYAATQDVQITISWQDLSTNEDGFAIEVKQGASAYVQCATCTTGPNATSFSMIVANDPGGVTYCAHVRAFNAAGNSAFGPEGCATSPGIVVVPVPPGAATIVIQVGNIHP